jgi:hypothetical protein
MKAAPMAEWSVRWGNPYTKPPDGRSVLKAVRVPWGRGDDKAVPKEIEELAGCNPGYAICWHAPETERKRWSPEALRRNRIKRIEKRAEKKYPLFKTEVVAADIEKYKRQGWI